MFILIITLIFALIFILQILWLAWCTIESAIQIIFNDVPEYKALTNSLINLFGNYYRLAIDWSKLCIFFAFVWLIPFIVLVIPSLKISSIYLMDENYIKIYSFFEISRSLENWYIIMISVCFCGLVASFGNLIRLKELDSFLSKKEKIRTAQEI